jgi:hypothetical protein
MSAERERLFVTEARGHARAVWDGINALLAMQNEWNALDYTSTLDDGTGTNEGVTKAHVSSCVFDTANELKLRIMDTAHKTNLARLL